MLILSDVVLHIQAKVTSSFVGLLYNIKHKILYFEYNPFLLHCDFFFKVSSLLLQYLVDSRYWPNVSHMSRVHRAQFMLSEPETPRETLKRNHNSWNTQNRPLLVITSITLCFSYCLRGEISGLPQPHKIFTWGKYALCKFKSLKTFIFFARVSTFPISDAELLT